MAQSLSIPSSKPTLFGWLISIYTGYFSNTKRLRWIDYARGIAILMVVYGHLVGGVSRTGADMDATLLLIPATLYNFRMPLFFFVSGLFLERSLQKRQVSGFLRNRFSTILWPYLLWGALQIGTQILLSSRTNSKKDISHLLYLFYDPQKTDQFWYLAALFNVAVVFALTYQVFKIRGLWQIALGLAFRFMSDYLEGFSLLHNFMYFYIFSAIGYNMSRLILEKNWLAKASLGRWALALMPIFVAGQWYWFTHKDDINTFLHMGIAFVGMVMIVFLCYALSKRDSLPVLRFIGYHSLYIYLIHVFIISGTRIAFTALGIHSIPVIVLTGFILGVGLPILFFHVAMRLGGWFLFSFDRKELESYHTA
ncbi:acyltransferase 3 [Fibrisoma limi BUZ 3]|uniref:Acyltransferase 3 n=1 Tax=Fibrisoma limi BUZ 3 TaxID=1185876 RepID=I2GQF5_9BACT|nr:acyltransferase [Fibrisoma limi]CCH56133.1 acyltransferase 3 [Fibrisoma limi BUZ 3]